MLLSFTPQSTNEFANLLGRAVIVTTLIWIIFTVTACFKERNRAVYEYKVDLLNRVSALAQADIKNGYGGMWRYLAMDKIGYFKLVFFYWIPLRDECIYEDLSFLNSEIRFTNN